ncbi:hypothetical protein LUZ63_013280 [Rhynchospora breviuscula]|uniref:Cullin N-terminal domain-containing protein n=1 Tax=Rhynchospora breviuscula TaxID=2022672 RepID=A0A9Q0C8A5_9POAL|nr:hypothetical protein LUZ63_013280 [Rhynchospora breviuscula]
MGENLYKRIEKECEVHISAKLSALVGQSPDLVKFLTLVQESWQDFCDQILLVQKITLSLDRKYVRHTLNVCSVWDLGLELFRKHLKLAPEVEHRIVTGILSLIESERLGAVVDTTLLSHLLKMFTALSDIPDYLKHVEKRLYNEDKRCKLYLEANTRKPLIAIAEKQLLEQHSSAILEKGFVMLIEAKQVNDL